MSAALAIAKPSETSRSERGYAPANDNVPCGCNLPSGRILAFENDGLGRQTLIAGGALNPNAGTTTTTTTGGTAGSTPDPVCVTTTTGNDPDPTGYNWLTNQDLYGDLWGGYTPEVPILPPPPTTTTTCVTPPPIPGTPGYSYTNTAPAYIADASKTYASNMAYHASGPLSGMIYGNGQVFTQSLNARLQPAHVQSALNTNVALDMTYTYDPRGKITNVLNAAITGDNRTYNYDALGRLTTATGPWGANHTTGTASYVYDALGNMQSKTVGPRALTMAYDGQNRLISHTDNIGPARNLSYDTRGNVTQLGGLFFTYDMSDQPTYISGTATGTYKYDGNLKRVKSTVDGKTIYNIYDAGGTLIHIDAVTDDKATDYIGKVARVTTSASVDTVTYLHADQLGSANTGTDANGLVVWREQYTPFGITLTSPLVNNDQAGFTGHIKDSATGLNYMQARYYDPLIGRFLSTDPIGFSPQRPEMFGRYTYVNNDPINMIDPFGEQQSSVGFTKKDYKNFNKQGKETSKQRKGARSDFRRNFRDMKTANTKGADKFFHCKANCQATQRGSSGEAEAETLSDLREVFGQLKGDPASDKEEDQAANEAGREGAKENPNQTCSATCSEFIVPGMNENGNFTEGEPVPEPAPKPEPEEPK